MTVFGHSTGGGFLTGRQVVPVDYEDDVSHRLLEATLSNDLKSAYECIADPLVDVNYVGAVSLKAKKTELVCRHESPIEVLFEYEEFKTDVTPLFLAVHAGNVALVRKLLVNFFYLCICLGIQLFACYCWISLICSFNSKNKIKIG